MISRYITEALHRARYNVVDGGLFCATVTGLPGVMATGKTLEACRDELVEVIEEWLLVRVAPGPEDPSARYGNRAGQAGSPAARGLT